ncbi:BglG family transcription antiterminator [Oenococcus oeni]|nr:PTS sugar transporter subunit IIA [Oenococcus oeni]
MTELDSKIVNYLHDRTNIKAKELAFVLKVTTRTIRYHIRSINQIYPGLLLANQEGYSLNDESYRKFLQSNKGNFISPSSAKGYIIMHLLQSSADGENILELASSLFISESYLRSLLNDLKRFAFKFNLQVSINHYHANLRGSERNKRRMILSILYGDGRLQNELQDTIQKLMGNVSIGKLYQIVIDVCSLHAVHLTPYATENIVMHYAIAIERIRLAKHIAPHGSLERLSENSIDFTLASEIVHRLPKELADHFRQGDIAQLAVLFVGNTLPKSPNNVIEAFVNPKIIVALHMALAQVSKNFLIELNNLEFFNRLALHVQGLLDRSQNGELISNSKAVEIKSTYPIIYDVAVYISSLLGDQLAIRLNDSEIALLALHIGAFIESAELNNDKPEEAISILIIAPEYEQILNEFIARLQNLVDHHIKLIVSISTPKTQGGGQYDLIITSNKIQKPSNNTITIHPIATKNDFDQLRRAISHVVKQKQKSNLRNLFDNYFSSELVFDHNFVLSKNTSDYLHYSVNKLTEAHIVRPSFFQELQEREQMSSTVFPTGVAIPHSMYMNAATSKIMIIRCQSPIEWGTQTAKLIFVVAQNSRDAKSFNRFFQLLIEVLSDVYNVDLLYKIPDSDKLLNTLYQFMRDSIE